MTGPECRGESNVSGMNSRRLLGIFLLAVLAGCNQTDSAGTLASAGEGAQQGQQQAPIIQGACPQIVLRDGTSVYRTYAGNAKGDPRQVTFQATLADTTRQCVQGENSITVTVMAQGRIAAGPAGSTGTVTLPIRVAASDGDTTLYSELTQFSVEIPADTGTAQFIFTDANVVIPGGAGPYAKIYLGFDEGPYNTR